MLENLFMQASWQKCTVCEAEAAAIFMVMRQDARTAKDYVCMNCFEAVQEYWGDAGLVEAVSLQEWKEVVDNTRLGDEGSWEGTEGT